MGNCALKGVSDTAKDFNFIRIMTDSGEILKLKGPKLVGEVLNSFPGYKIFGQGHFSIPLFDHEELLGGRFYYLLPLDQHQTLSRENVKQQPVADVGEEEGNEREPVRVSSAAFDLVTSIANGSALEVLAPPQKGVWRVKLAINPRQLEEILAEEVNTEALIEQMRMAAAATSATVTPKRTSKSSWGLMLKPILGNILRAPIGNQKDEVKSVDLYTNCQAKANDLQQTSLLGPCD